jgi:XTP/dITP diphosphohydrolase
MAGWRLRLVCASANPGKVAELQEILGDVVELLPRPADVPDVVEDSGTLVGNARLKASAIAVASGLPALADDTGLEVDALGGLPGVDTAFFAGPDATDGDNRSKLLADLAALGPQADRRARFRTIAMVRWPDGEELWAEGTCEVRSPPKNAAHAGSATTASSYPLTATGGRSPR